MDSDKIRGHHRSIEGFFHVDSSSKDFFNSLRELVLHPVFQGSPK